jgi:predicted small lipoprotein YifL
MSEARLVGVVFAASLLGSLAACGQKGPLYLPDQPREVVTRPVQAPAPDAQAPNSPQTVDSPEGSANPAPEVTAPQKDNSDKEKKEPDATAPR